MTWVTAPPNWFVFVDNAPCPVVAFAVPERATNSSKVLTVRNGVVKVCDKQSLWHPRHHNVALPPGWGHDAAMGFSYHEPEQNSELVEEDSPGEMVTGIQITMPVYGQTESEPRVITIGQA